MTVYAFIIEYVNAEGISEYQTIKGIFASREDAKEEAITRFNAQRAMWQGSYYVGLKKGVVMLRSLDGDSKIYRIKEYEVK